MLIVCRFSRVKEKSIPYILVIAVIIVVIVIIVAVIVIGYLFWPTESAYRVKKKKYVYRSGGKRTERVKDIKKSTGGISYSLKSIGDKIRKIFKRKRKKGLDEIELKT